MAHSRIPARGGEGDGGITREGALLGGRPLVLALPGPASDLGTPPGVSRLLRGLGGPPLAPGGLLPITASRSKGRYGFSKTPQPRPSWWSSGGKGACGRSSCRKGGAGEPLGAHLDSLLMTRIRAAFSSLSRWLSARRSDRACGVAGGQRGALGRLTPGPQHPLPLHLQLFLQFRRLALQGPALLQWTGEGGQSGQGRAEWLPPTRLP